MKMKANKIILIVLLIIFISIKDSYSQTIGEILSSSESSISASINLSSNEKKALQIVNEWTKGNRVSPITKGNNGEIEMIYGLSQPHILTAILQVTDIQFEQGETITSIHLGDTARWSMEHIKANTIYGYQDHIIVKPKDINLLTSDRFYYYGSLGRLEGLFNTPVDFRLIGKRVAVVNVYDSLVVEVALSAAVFVPDVVVDVLDQIFKLVDACKLCKYRIGCAGIAGTCARLNRKQRSRTVRLVIRHDRLIFCRRYVNLLNGRLFVIISFKATELRRKGIVFKLLVNVVIELTHKRGNVFVGVFDLFRFGIIRRKLKYRFGKHAVRIELNVSVFLGKIREVFRHLIGVFALFRVLFLIVGIHSAEPIARIVIVNHGIVIIPFVRKLDKVSYGVGAKIAVQRIFYGISFAVELIRNFRFGMSGLNSAGSERRRRSGYHYGGSCIQ